MIFIAVLVAGCSAATGTETPRTADPDLAAAVMRRTAPDRPLRVVFDWVARDGEARFTGSGVARIEPPYRARLDLFGRRGESYVSAAAVGDELRLPPGVDAPLPPPALMWGVLGVVAPPDGARLVGTRTADDRTELHYDVAGDRLVYVLETGALRSVEWEGDRRLSVSLEEAAELGLPRQAVYRDWKGNTELMLTLENAGATGPFPPEIWRPDA
jgi:hypothetical protein